MTAKEVAVLGAEPILTMEANFDENDLVTVAVAKGEVMMRESLQEKKNLIKDEHIKLTKLQKEYNSSFNNVKTPFEKHMNELLKVLKKVDKEVIVEVTVEHCMSDYVKKTDDRKDMNNCTLYINRNVFNTKVIAETTAQKKLRLDIDKSKDTLQTLEREAIDIKRKLSDIPALERQMRAKVVEHQLNKSTDGKRLLETLTSGKDMEPTLKLLGM